MVYIALTFDDGYLYHYRVGLELAKQGMPGTFFIITHRKYHKGKPLLTLYPDSIRELSILGHEIGSHTATHRELTRLSTEDVEKECLISKMLLEGLIRQPIVSFAYPYGSYNIQVINVVSKYYKFARITGSYNRWNLIKNSPFTIGSITIRHIPELILRKILKCVEGTSIVFHDESLSLILRVVNLLRRIVRVRFVTFKELANILGF